VNDLPPTLQIKEWKAPMDFTACNLVNIVKANWHYGLPSDGKLLEQRVISTQTGVYPVTNHPKYEHVLKLTYERAIKWFDGERWTRHEHRA